MKWFQGNINEAVAASKSRKAIFVVFVEGKDDTSLEISKAIDSQEISSRLEQDDFVAIKLEGGSESYGFFAQIYRTASIPSLFFIGQNGSPIEVIAESTSVTELAVKIDTVLETVGSTLKNSSKSFIESEQKESSSGSSSLKSSETEISAIDLNGAKSEAKMAPAPATSKQEQEKDEEVKIAAQSKSSTPIVGESEIKTVPKKLDSPSTSSAASEASKTPELTAEEKLERARQLIELQKRQREEEEAKKIREREIQRRKTGQEMIKIKQKQQDLEIKQAHDERMKEKAAEAAARDRVRQQIAQDKLERKQRQLDLQKEQQYQQNPAQEQPKPRTPVSSDSNTARIQFRLPSGNPHMGQFDSTSTLGVLRAYVVQNIELPFRNFSLSTSFPRRELTVKDDDKTLLELELTSSTTAVTSAQDDGYLSRFMWAIYASVISVYNYITGYFTRPPRPAEQQNSGADAGGVEPTTSNDRPISRLVQGAAPPSGLVRRNIGGQASTTIRTQGNVHRLHSGGDKDNDENNTWNGNSTQQM